MLVAQVLRHLSPGSSQLGPFPCFSVHLPLAFYHHPQGLVPLLGDTVPLAVSTFKRCLSRGLPEGGGPQCGRQLGAVGFRREERGSCPLWEADWKERRREKGRSRPGSLGAINLVAMLVSSDYMVGTSSPT